MVTSDSEEPSGSFQNTNAETSDSRKPKTIAWKFNFFENEMFFESSDNLKYVYIFELCHIRYI